jgi:hypothetical protein
MLNLDEYRQLLVPSSGDRYSWHTKILRGGDLARFQHGAMTSAHGTFGDSRKRPFAAAFMRLFWEMSDVTHEEGGDRSLKKVFVDDEDVRLALTVGGPWGEYFVEADDLDGFLAEAAIIGDGSLGVQNFFDAQGEHAVGVGFERIIDFSWLNAPWRGNVFFGEGNGARDGKLEIAFLYGGAVSIIDCGRPYFGSIPGSGAKWVVFDGAYWGLPAIFQMNGERFYVPCSEPGGAVILNGTVAVSDDQGGTLATLGAGLESPYMAVKIIYSPGWLRCDGVYPWSEMSPDAQWELKEQSTVVNRL